MLSNCLCTIAGGAKSDTNAFDQPEDQFVKGCIIFYVLHITATAKRIRNDTKTTLRRRTSTRSRGTTTSRRMSTNVHDVAVSMLPDLSENLSNEERTWEEIMQIKAMPVCMAQKMQLKNQLQVC